MMEDNRWYLLLWRREGLIRMSSGDGMLSDIYYETGAYCRYRQEISQLSCCRFGWFVLWDSRLWAHLVLLLPWRFVYKQVVLFEISTAQSMIHLPCSFTRFMSTKRSKSTLSWSIVSLAGCRRSTTPNMTCPNDRKQKSNYPEWHELGRMFDE